MAKKTNKLVLSFAEIVIIVFITIVMFCILLGKIFGVSQQSKVIYNWKKTLESAQYSYNVILLTQRQQLMDYVKSGSQSRNQEILNMFKSTLNTDVVGNKKEQKSLKNYKYRFLNGKQVPKESKYYAQNFTYSPDGTIIAGLNWLNQDCFETDNLCAVMIFDMNGVKLPNRFGLDVFGLNIYNNRLEPFGTGLSYEENQRNCRRLETGVTCSKFYLMGGQFFK